MTVCLCLCCLKSKLWWGCCYSVCVSAQCGYICPTVMNPMRVLQGEYDCQPALSLPGCLLCLSVSVSVSLSFPLCSFQSLSLCVCVVLVLSPLSLSPPVSLSICLAVSLCFCPSLCFWLPLYVSPCVLLSLCWLVISLFLSLFVSLLLLLMSSESKRQKERHLYRGVGVTLIRTVRDVGFRV